MDDNVKKHAERSEVAKDIQDDLSHKGLSRRVLLDRLKGLGVGFGAAFVLGAKGAAARGVGDTSASLSSTNPVLNDIIQEGRHDSDKSAISPEMEDYYARFYRRGYFRGYRRFYQRGYFRGYRRFYARF